MSGLGRHPATDLGAAVRALAEIEETALTSARRSLLLRWSGAGRGYHDREHLTEVLDRLADLAAGGDGAALAPQVVLAAWFHDAVYRGRPGQDEQASAELAVRTLTELGVPAEHRDRVRDLVLLTRDHLPPADDAQGAALCDADLAILAADHDRYLRYAHGVRVDYRHVPGPVFRVGRARVLRGLLARAEEGQPRPLYLTKAAATWTPAAIENLRAELTRLRRAP